MNGKPIPRTDKHSRVHIAGTKVKSVHHLTQHNLGTHTDYIPKNAFLLHAMRMFI